MEVVHKENGDLVKWRRTKRISTGLKPKEINICMAFKTRSKKNGK
jgi:hypothetical protein